MALLSGNLTYKKFRITEVLPKNFKDSVVQNLPRHAFREINPKTNPEYSLGWVNAFDQVDTHLGLDKILFGKYILLGLRRDKKNVAAALLKAQLSKAIKAQLRERKGRKLSREEQLSIKETVRETMLAQVSPVTTFYEMVWNYETQEVYFSAQAGKAATEFAEIFEETFKLPLEELSLVTRTEAYILDKGLSLELIDIESANFGN